MKNLFYVIFAAAVINSVVFGGFSPDALRDRILEGHVELFTN